MTRILLAVGLVAVMAGPAAAQNIVVTRQPGADGWDVSYTRVMDGNSRQSAEFDCTCGTLAAAQRAAVRLQQWSRSMQPPDGWCLKTIYIEGDDKAVAAGLKEGSGPKTMGFVRTVQDKMDRDKGVLDGLKSLGDKVGNVKDKADLVKWVGELLTDPDAAMIKKGKAGENAVKSEAGLRGYVKNAQDTYQRAKEAKDGMLGLTSTLAEKQFAKVNGLVDQFNRTAAAAPSGYGPVSGLMPTMTKVGPETVKQADAWREAVQTQFKLEQQKEKLDADKVRLDAQRRELLSEWQKLGDNPDPADPRVVRLRERLEMYKEQATGYEAAVRDQAAAVQRLGQVTRRFRPASDAEAAKPRSKDQEWGLEFKDKKSTDVPSIAGRWKAARGSTVFTYNFETDGTYRVDVKSPYFAQNKFGKWTQIGDKLTVRQSDSGAPGTGGFSKGREVEVKILSSNKLLIDGDEAELVARAETPSR